MYVVAGVTGHTGKVVAETLLAEGQKVRVIARDAAKAQALVDRGAELALGNLEDVAFLARAAEGAKGIYLLAPPNMAAAGTAQGYIEDRTAAARTMAEAVRRARVPAVVFLSSVGAQHATGVGPVASVHHAEAALRDVAPSVTFVRAAYFVENWGAVVGAVTGNGVLPYFGSATRAFAQVSTRDIGRTAARALTDARPGTHVIELAGPVDLSPHDVARAFSAILGKPVEVGAAPAEAAAGALKGMGMPPGLAELYGEMYVGIASGHMDFEHPQRVVRGTTAIEETLRTLVG